MVVGGEAHGRGHDRLTGHRGSWPAPDEESDAGHEGYGVHALPEQLQREELVAQFLLFATSVRQFTAGGLVEFRR